MSTFGLQSSGSDFVGGYAALKEIYEPVMAKAAIDESELWECFTEQDSFPVTEGPDGKQITMAHVFSAGGGYSSMLENDYFPASTVAQIKQSSLTIKQVVIPIEISGRTMRRMKQGPAAFWEVQDLLQLKTERFAFHKDRALLGYGAGIVGRINDASPATTDLGLDSALGIAGLDGVEKLILEDDNLRFGPNANGSSLRSGTAKVGTIDYDNVEIDIDALPTSTADDDYVFLGDANVNTSGSREPMGLEGLVDDGTILSSIQGLSRTTYPRMQSQVINAATANSGEFAGQTSEELISYLDRRAWERGKGKPSMYVCSYAQRDVFWKVTKANVTLNDPAGNYSQKVGRRGKGFTLPMGDRDVYIKPARKIPNSRAYFIEPKTLKLYRIGAGRWDDTTGSMWDRVTDSTGRKDAFWSVFLEEFEIGTNMPSHNIKVTGLVGS